MGENNDNFKLGRLEPSETKLGDNKIIGRDYAVTLGLFNPVKFGLQTYLGYTMKLFNENFRSLHILKHRNGIAGHVKAMWFAGHSNKFEELPQPSKKDELETFLKQKNK